ncbi:hypothetical protein BCR33DRAFT_713409 [Rhizoclosmatium globosum]|uniref:G-protein coupled receptors family 1 profile domain-containing protein n=1 Tax=Rhizoclosmatium globosum TaxID=329046 RepID=A0A1Y2CS48_9FUNG|nr:hypothetical protein BCR33DRAFT_713409 [Rhizoclosmatium globosum]|eukprot:ORY49797.1 hypothetical protein BCR33DRAFT_713409 [Rhizoclosmatium globosum]
MATIQEWSLSPSNLIRHEPQSLSDIYALHGAALVVIYSSILGAGWMFYDSIKTKKYETLSGRFPMYMAALNFCWSVSHSVDHLWMILEKGDSPPDSACKVLGGLLSVFMMAELFLIDIMALYMLGTVYYGNRFSLGTYDWMLFVLIIGVPICYVIVTGSVGALGHDYYWCLLDISIPAGRIVMGITAAAACVCVAVPAVCFFLIYRKLKEHVNNVKGAVNNQGFTSSVMKKLLAFQGIVTVSFCGVAITGTSISAFKYEPTGLVWLTILTLNSGGWLNAVAYYMQEHVFCRERSKSLDASPGRPSRTLVLRNSGNSKTRSGNP